MITRSLYALVVIQKESLIFTHNRHTSQHSGTRKQGRGWWKKRARTTVCVATVISVIKRCKSTSAIKQRDGKSWNYFNSDGKSRLPGWLSAFTVVLSLKSCSEMLGYRSPFELNPVLLCNQLNTFVVMIRFVPPEQAKVVASVHASISGSSASSTSSTPEVRPLKTLLGESAPTLHLNKHTPSQVRHTHTGYSAG